VVAQVKPGYLRHLIPGMLEIESAYDLKKTCFTAEAAPQRGEDWESIVDDYQKFIIPGAHSFFLDRN
jgi:hypothetical protein